MNTQVTYFNWLYLTKNWHILEYFMRYQEIPLNMTQWAFNFYLIQAHSVRISLISSRVVVKRLIAEYSDPSFFFFFAASGKPCVTCATHTDLCFLFFFFFSSPLSPTIMSPLIQAAVRNAEDGDYAKGVLQLVMRWWQRRKDRRGRGDCYLLQVQRQRDEIKIKKKKKEPQLDTEYSSSRNHSWHPPCY